MTFRPLSDFVLVRLDPEEERRGALVIPETARRQINEGCVVAAGPGRHVNVAPRGERERLRWRAMPLKPGERVVIVRNVGTWLDEAERLLIVQQDHVHLHAPEGAEVSQ